MSIRSVFGWLSEKQVQAQLNEKDYVKEIAKVLAKIDKSSKKNDVPRTAWLYQLASVMARKAKQWKDSVDYALMAAEYSEREGKLFNAGWSYRSAAIAARNLGDYRNATEYALTGADYFRRSKAGYAAKWCYNIAARSCEESGDHDSAIKYYEHAFDIEPDEETRHEIERLKHVASHPKVDQYADKAEAVEYDPVKFEVVVENHGKELIRNVVVGSRDGKLSHEIGDMQPGDVKVFSFKTKARMGRMESPYNFVSWSDSRGKSFGQDLCPAEIRVRPRIQVEHYISPEPILGKESELVVMVKNLSSSPLYDVKLDLDFASRVEARRLSPAGFMKLEYGKERGTDWKIKPTVLGMQQLADVGICMKDDRGNEYERRLKPVLAEVLEKPHPDKKPFQSKTEFREERKNLGDSITAYPLSESEYVSRSKSMYHLQRGCAIKDAGFKEVTEHVLENLKGMAQVSSHELRGELMLLYSFTIGGLNYLLTVVIKEEEGIVHLILKLYSEERESLARVLDMIADIISYTLLTETDAKKVEKVEIKKIINIVDSIVQRSSIAEGGSEGEVTDKVTDIKDSVVQRTKV